MILTCASCGSANRVPPSRLHQGPRCGQCKGALRADAPVEAGSALAFDELVRESSLPVVVDFWAAWCGPCRMAAPEFARLARERAGQLLVVKLDTDAVPEVAARYGIQGIPTFVRFDQGREVSRASGAMPAAQIARSLGL